ncbi:MAG: hypothetical protein ACM37W_15065 [Actinomycetota bacterium]
MNTPPSLDQDATFSLEVQRLYQLTVYGRWLVVALLWIGVAPLSCWGLRNEIELWLEHFTWAAVRYGLIYHRLPTLGLGLCVGVTLAVSIWQSRNWIFGLPARDKQRLEQQVRRIRQQGPTHPLWKWVCRF